MTAPAQPEAATVQPPAILAAIWKVMKQVTYVPKAGQYDGGKSGSYKFRKFEDTAAALGDAFRAHGVFVQSEVVSRVVAEPDKKPYSSGSGYTAWSQVFLTVKYRFTSLEDGSVLEASAAGEGKDSSDKASSKAMTMAMKYALTQAFMIATEDPDPDSERPGDFSPPVGQGQGYDPNAAARDRQQAQRQAANDAGVQAPSAGGMTREEKNVQMIEWVRQQTVENPNLNLERLAYVHMIVDQRGLLGIDAGGTPLGLRIKAEMARWGIDPNRAMPTPEQAKAWMQENQGGGN